MAKGSNQITSLLLQKRRKVERVNEINKLLTGEARNYVVDPEGAIRHETVMDRVSQLGPHQHFNSAQETQASQKKRKPILLDYVVEGIRRNSTAGLPYVSPKERSTFFDMMPSIKKFVLDDQAVRYLGQYIREHPEKIAAANEYAIPPFRTMWVEYSVPVMYEAVNGRELDELGDRRIGYLFNGPDVLLFVEGPSHAGAEMSPLRMRLNRPATLEEELEFCRLMGVSRIAISPFMWGTVGPRVKVEHPDLYEVLRANHAYIMATSRTDDLPDGALARLFEEAAGDLRNVIALLVFLNRTQDVQVIEEKKPKPGLIMRKPRSYIGHSVITLKLNPIERLKRIGASGVSGPKRLHDVRGHYCRNKTAKHAEEAGDSCEALDRTDPLFYLTTHDWKEVEGSKHVDQKTGAIMTWKCSRCKGVMWRKPEHQRGTLKQGVVVQEYVVTAKAKG